MGDMLGLNTAGPNLPGELTFSDIREALNASNIGVDISHPPDELRQRDEQADTSSNR